MKFLTFLLILTLFTSKTLLAQQEDKSPKYLSVATGNDNNTEKADRILATKPSFISIALEKRLPKSELYGIGLYAQHFNTEYENYNHLSFRGYQHFGDVRNAHAGNIDPYIGVMVGLDFWQSTMKPALGIFGGLRLMLTTTLGVHAEIASVSSGFNNSLTTQVGITTCFLKSDKKKPKKYYSKCPKF